MDNSVETGQMIRNARKRKGLSQEQLAKMVNLSTMSIRRYERGERIIPDEKFQDIVKVLGDSFYDTLIQYIDETPQRIEKKMEIRHQQQEEEEAEFRRKVIEEAQEDIKAFVYSENGLQIILHYLELNEKGQDEAVSRIIEMTYIPEYQRTEPLNGLEADGGDTAPTNEEKPPNGLEKPNDGIRGNAHD